MAKKKQFVTAAAAFAVAASAVAPAITADAASTTVRLSSDYVRGGDLNAALDKEYKGSEIHWYKSSIDMNKLGVFQTAKGFVKGKGIKVEKKLRVLNYAQEIKPESEFVFEQGVPVSGIRVQPVLFADGNEYAKPLSSVAGFNTDKVGEFEGTLTYANKAYGTVTKTVKYKVVASKVAFSEVKHEVKGDMLSVSADVKNLKEGEKVELVIFPGKDESKPLAPYTAEVKDGKVMVSAKEIPAGTHSFILRSGDVKTAAMEFKVEEQAPKVESVSAINATSLDSVSINDSFKYVFSKELDEKTVNGNTFQLLKGAAVTPVKVTLGEDKKTVTVKPTSNLSINSDYTLVVKTDVKDKDGKALASEHKQTFKTNNNAIATQLTINNNASSAIDTDVKADEVVVTTSANQFVVSYNAPLAFDAGSKSNVELVDSTGKAVDIDTVVASGSTLTVDLGDATKVLKNGTYTLKVKSLSTPDGRKVDAFTRTFSVTDGTLSVLGTTLADGSTALTGNKKYGKLATKYNDNGAVVNYGFKTLVKFSVDVDASTINSNTIVLKKASNGEVVPATVTYNADAKTAAVVPTADLADLTDYQLVVSVGDTVKDKFGNKLKQVDPVAFKTDDTTAPSVVKTTPANGASSVDLDGSFSLTFDDAIDPASLKLSTTAGAEATAGLATVTGKSVFLKNETTNAYVDVDALFNVELSADKKTVTFKLKTGQTLPASNSFTLSLRGGKDHAVVTDATAGDDTAIALAETYKLSFATNAGDEVGPTFVEAKQGTDVLANGAKSVNASGNIEFYYNEAIKLPTAAQTGSLYSLKLNDGSTKTLGAKIAPTPVGTSTALNTATITVPDLNANLAVGEVVKVTIGSNVYYRTVASAYANGATSLVLNAGLPEATVANSTVEVLPLQVVNNTTDKKYKVVVTLNAPGTQVANDNTYTLKLTEVFADAAGNKAKEPTLTFTTGPAPVLLVADATKSTPFKFDNDFGVEETAFIQVSDDTDLTTVTDETLYFAKADGTKAPYEIVAKSATTTALGDTTAINDAFTNVDTIKINDAGTGSTTTNVTDVAAGDILFVATDNVFVKVLEVTQGTGETTIKVDRKVTVSDKSVVTRVPAVMLQPKSGQKLDAKTTYKVVVKDGIVDKAGNPMKATEYAFTTGAVTPEKLSVASTTITDGATGVKVNAPLSITFNEEVKNPTLSAVIKINAARAGDVTSKFTIKKDSTDAKKVIIEPKGYLAANTVYTVSVLPTATSIDGDSTKNIGTQKDYSFQTEAKASVEPKAESAVYFDTNGNSKVDAGDVIRLTFSTVLASDNDATSDLINAADDFIVTGPGSTLAGSTASYTAGNKYVDITLADASGSVAPSIALGVTTIKINNITSKEPGAALTPATWTDELGNAVTTDAVVITKN